jgi:hypothetical protein
VQVVEGSLIYNFSIHTSVHFYSNFWSISQPNRGPWNRAGDVASGSRMNRWVCSGSSDGRVEARREVLSIGSSALDDLTVHRSIQSEQLCQLSSAVDGQQLVAPDEPTSGKA